MNQTLVKSALTENKREGLTDQYRFIPTTDIVNQFTNTGWMVSRQSEVNVRKPEREGFQKHTIRFRHENKTTLSVGEYLHELVLINSHDGLSSMKLFHGLFRLVCSNGLTVSAGILGGIKITHKGDQNINMNYILDNFMSNAGIIDGRVQAYKNRILPDKERLDFASEALKLRWDDPPITPDKALNIRRRVDIGQNDLWSTLNIIQENLMKGGLSYVKEEREFNLDDGHLGYLRGVQHTRALKNIDKSNRFNQGLWDIADRFLN